MQTDKRVFIAVILMGLVLVGVPMLFPGAKAPVTIGADSARLAGDSLTAAAVAPAAMSDSANAAAVTTPGSDLPGSALTPSTPGTVSARAETTTVTTKVATYRFATPGAVPISVALPAYKTLTQGRGGDVDLVRRGERLARLRLAVGGDTIALDTLPMTVEQGQGNGARTVQFRGTATVAGAAAPVEVRYTIPDSSFALSIEGSVANAPAGSHLLVDLPRALRSAEADTADDIRHLAYAHKPTKEDVVSIPFSKLEPTIARTDSGPLRWAAARSKYFVVAFVTPKGRELKAIRMVGAPERQDLFPEAQATAAQPLADGRFALTMYAGPQQWTRLRAIGDEMENVNPYGGFAAGFVQPFATIIMRLLLWMKATLAINYGWVLILFGIGIRVLLWPLYQGSMRTSIKMQALQPMLQDAQKRFKDDPEKQREAIMKIYADHGMSPFTPLAGCLPMLLPMPVLFALYHVFQNTIEFRGVSFWWLPDIAQRDPYYIIPVVMGLSMFVLSWIGMRGQPANPQAKMMGYMLPVIMTVMFLNFPSGLNLYYAVQNLAALPQQWLLSRERLRATPTGFTPAPDGPPAGASASVAGGSSRAARRRESRNG